MAHIRFGITYIPDEDFEQMLAESGLGKRLAEAEAMAARLAASEKARADALAHLRRVPTDEAIAVFEGRKDFDPKWADDGDVAVREDELSPRSRRRRGGDADHPRAPPNP